MQVKRRTDSEELRKVQDSTDSDPENRVNARMEDEEPMCVKPRTDRPVATDLRFGTLDSERLEPTRTNARAESEDAIETKLDKLANEALRLKLRTERDELMFTC